MATDPEKIARLRNFLVLKGLDPDTETSARAQAVVEFELSERERESKSMPYDKFAEASGLMTDVDRAKLKRLGAGDYVKAADTLTGYKSPVELGKTDLTDPTLGGQFPQLGGKIPTPAELDVRQAEAVAADRMNSKDGGMVPAPFSKVYWILGQGPVSIEKGKPMPFDSLHPMEAYEAGYREEPNGFEVSLWEKRHRALRMEKAGMGGIAKGLSNTVRGGGYALELGSKIAGLVDKVTGLNSERSYKTLSDAAISAADNIYDVGENTQRFMWGKGLNEGPAARVGGQAISGISEIMAMGPMFRVLGKYALPIYEGIRGWGESNPDTEVDIPGVGKVKGRLLPTVLGTAHGAALGAVLKWAERTPGIAGRAKGAAAFGLPDIIGQVVAKEGIDPEALAASLTMGGLMTHGVPTGKAAREFIKSRTGDFFKPGPGDVTLETLDAMNREAGGKSTALMGLGGRDLSWLRRGQEDKVPLGNLEPGRSEGRSSIDITRDRVETMEKVIDVLDPRVPEGGKPIGPTSEGVKKNEMFQRTDEEGNPIPSRGYMFMGTGLKELDWLKNKRQDVKFAKANSRSVYNIETVEKTLTKLNGGVPIPTEGSAIRKNADLYVFSFDVDQMCPRSQGQRNTQTLVERVTGKTLTADQVADLREFMKSKGEAVACPQCYTESHRIAKDFMAVNERPLGSYNYGDLQKLLSTPKGREQRTWLDIHTGFRMNANTDFKPQHLPQIMKAVTDAAEMGMHGNGYLKRFEGVDALAPTRMRMNLSIGSDLRNGQLVENLDIGVPWEPAMARRSKYDNVGTVNIVKTFDEFWASMEHPEIDHIIGLHHSNIPVRVRERWGALDDFTSVQSDHWKPGISIEQKAQARREYEAYCKGLGVKPLYLGKVGDEHPAIGDWMHKGDIDVFFALCDRFGLKPRLTGSKTSPDFSEGGTNPNYMKAVGPECGKFGDNTREPMVADFNWAAVRNSLNNFAQYGGLELESWYSTTGAEYLINKLRPRLNWKAPEADVKKWGSEPTLEGKAVTTEEAEGMKRTSRSGGAIAPESVVYRAVLSEANPGEKILDFGAGKEATQARLLREQGLDVTAHDLWAQEGVHDPTALERKYDLVYGSRVLNVQPSDSTLRETVRQMSDAVAPGGRLIANLPDPLKGAYEGKTKAEARLYLESILKERFNTVEFKDGVFRASDPIPAKSELESALEEVGEDYAGTPEVEGQAARARVDKYRPPVSAEEWQRTRDELFRRQREGEAADVVMADLRKRGYNVRKTEWGDLMLLREPTVTQRKAAGEPQGLPENPGKYPIGKNIGKNTTQGDRKSPYIKERVKTLWDIMRKLSAGTEGSYNLLRDQGVPGPEMTHSAEANAWERAAYWADEKGNLMTNIREVLKNIADGPIPLWHLRALENSTSHTATATELQGYAKFLLSLEHVDGPVRWGYDKRPGVGGVYEPDTGLINLNPSNEFSPQNAIHEAAHGAGMRFRSRLSPENWDTLKTIWERTRNIASDTPMYGDTDVFEHGAETLANTAFRSRTELAGKREAMDTTMVAMGNPEGKARGLSGQALRDYVERDSTLGERSVELSEAVAKESREGLTVDMPAHTGGLKIRENLGSIYAPTSNWTTFRVELPGGQVLSKNYTIERNGRSEAEMAQAVRAELNEKWIKGTYLMGLGGKDVEAIKRALVGAPGVTKQDEQKAVEFFKKLEAKEPSRAPEAPGVPMKSDRTIIPYGTVEKGALEKSGIIYKSEVGKPQQTLDEYDKHAATMRDLAEREPVLSAEMEKPLPDRPSNFAEVFPDAPVVKDFIKVAGDTAKGAQGWVETGLRYVERAGGGPMNIIKEVFYTPMKRGVDEIEKSLNKELERVKGIAQYVGLTTKYKDSLELGKWLTARQHGGEKTLELSGMTADEAAGYKVGEPPAPIKKMMRFMDGQLLQAFHEVNRERIRSGQEPLEWRKDYFTFWHAADALNKEGLSLFSTPKEAVDKAMAEWERNYENDLSTKQAEFRAKSRFSKWMFQKRTGNLGPIDLDAYGVFTRYMRSAYEQMYLSQAQSVMKKLVDGTWEVDGKEWKLSDANKPMRDSLSNYLGFLATGAKPGEIPKPIFEVLNKLGRNVAVGKVGLNFKSSLNQLTSNVHSMAQLGVKYWTQGFADYAKAQIDGIAHGKVEGGKWAEAREAGDLGTRSREAAFEEFKNKRPPTAFGRGLQKAGMVGMAPLQMLDMVTAEITWRGAYRKAMDGQAEGMMGKKADHARAVDYANAEVVRTQGSTQKADITPFQRGQYGKVLGVLQNFVINEWGFVTRDVMGIHNADKGNPEHVARAVRFVVGAMLVDWLYEDVMGIKSPFNVLANPMQTIRPAAEEYKKSGNVLKAAGAAAVGAASTVPLIGRGFTPYGAGGGLGAGVETVQKGGELAKKPTIPGAIDWLGSMAGVPGSFATSRAIKIREKGGTWPQALSGATPEKTSSKPKKVYDPATGTWKPAPKPGGKKRNKVYNPETGEWK